MPSKHRFSEAEKFGVWHTFQSKCFWCGQPLSYKDTTIDHVIPEIYEQRPEQLATIKVDYGLGKDFQINDFTNWVPAHFHCNTSKNDTLYRATPAMIRTLHTVSSKSSQARQKAERIQKIPREGKLLAQVRLAIEQDVLSEELVEEFKTLFIPSATEAVPDEPITYDITPGWKIVQTQGSITYLMSDKGVFGYTTALANPHHSWFCTNCGSKGPWSGARCLVCGMLDEGD